MAGRVPAALRSRLGDDATFGLIEFMEAERKTWSEEVLAAATNKYEARLTAELAALRRDVTQELATTRTEMLRWSFVFWIGQVAAISALVVFRH
jgi:hypothetical protein